MSDGIQARAASLRKEATRRWLVKDELVFLLLHYSLVGVPVLQSLQLRPPSGTLLFYNTLTRAPVAAAATTKYVDCRVVVSDYKKDGWHWQKRKDKSGRVREDRAKLVINRQVIILGTYVHSAETSTFHRRIYSVRDSKENIILVHYFDEIHKESVPRQLAAESHESSSNRVKRLLPVAKINDASASVMLSFHPSPPNPLSSDEMVDSIMKNCFEMDFEPHATSYENSSLNISDEDLLLLKDSAMDGITTVFGVDDLFNDLSSATSPEQDISGLGGQQTFELAEISDFSPDWDFGDGGAKILICLAAKLPEILAQDPMKLFVQFGGKRVRAEKVSDTVLRCTAPSSRDLGSVDIYVCHWNGSVPQESIPLSHRKQFTYRSHYQVSPSLVGEIEREKQFSEAGAGTIDPLELASSYPTQMDERQCKIRVVERLSEFHQAIRTKTAEPTTNDSLSLTDGNKSGETSSPSQTENGSLAATLSSSGSPTNQSQHVSQQTTPLGDSVESSASSISPSEASTALDDCTIETLSDNDLEQLSEKLLERVVRQLVTVAHTSEELLEELNSLDETGLSLLHYVSFYNYSQLVPVLVAHGAHINQQSTQGQTALHLAAGCGHDEVVNVLLQSGADLQVHDFDGLTAADRAEKSGHTEVAAKLHRHMGYDTSSDMGLVDEIFGLGGSPMEIDDVPTPYMDAGDMGLLSDNDNIGLNERPRRSHSSSCESPCESTLSSKATSYVRENQEHNRKLLLGAFSTMSLHDKCALSLSISRDSASHVSRRRESSIGEEMLVSPSSSTGTSAGFGSSPASIVGMDANLVGGRLGLSGAENDSDVQSVIADEEGLNKLQAAMELMGPEEKQSLEDEVKVLQHGIRAWLLKRNCKNMRETTKQLREATQSIEDQSMMTNELSERERAAVTVQAATRSMLARRSFLQTKQVTIKFQAATRGVLCRKNFARMKAHALASLVIQRNVREWWNKQPAAARPDSIDKEADEENDTEEKASIPQDAYE
ncbi:Calmodulin-binding transcription activator [Phytophthora megakarya]|uniref:Calmodulin-binding transcription activator n=1 Tax=Phytophthora megakarya TaxID=4795 RepID=A0A225WZQ9_9STRA|nr:Calmodulin-binding transcription activator [Phytophthora megakarya]